MNNKKLIVVAVSAASLITAGVVSAADNTEGWKSSAELGLVNTSGNTETSTINAKFNAGLEQEEWRHKIALSALGSSTTDTTTDVKTTSNEKYALNGKSDYKFNESDFMFGSLDYEKDRFSGYAYEATVTLGYGRRLINDEDMKFDLEIGPGARKVEDAATGITETDGIVRVGAKLDWKVSETSKFTEDFTADFSSEFNTIKSVTALTTKVNSSLALKVSLTIKNNSEVPVGTEKTDTETAITLVYSF